MTKAGLISAIIFITSCNATTSTVSHPWQTLTFVHQKEDVKRFPAIDPLGPGCYSEIYCGCANKITTDYCIEDLWLVTKQGQAVVRLKDSQRGETLILCDQEFQEYREQFYLKRLELLAQEFLAKQVCPTKKGMKIPGCKIKLAAEPYLRVVKYKTGKDPRFCIVYDYEIKGASE